MRFGAAGKARYGTARCGKVWQGTAGMVSWGRLRSVKARFVMAGYESQKGDKVMIYKWKIPGVIPVDAQTAGEELQRIYQEKGRLNPSDIVEESRNDSAPLHPCFEWDDEIAAEKYRQTQAMQIVRSIVTIQESGKEEPQEVRAFVHVQESYHPISVVVSSKEQMQELLASALSELKAFQRKYNSLVELSLVFDAIEKVIA